MIADTASEAPPLAVWAWVAGFLLVIVGVIATLYFRVGTLQSQFEGLNRQRLAALEAQIAAEPQGLTIVAVGTSLLQYGTAARPVVEHHIGRALHGERVRHLRITHNASMARHFEGLWTPILDLKPALVVIEADLLTADSTPAWDDHAFELQRLLLSVAKGDLASKVAAEQAEPDDRALAANVGRHQLRKQDFLQDRRFEHPPSALAVARLRAIVASGARVLVVGIPRCDEYEAHIREEKHGWLTQLQADPTWKGRLRVAAFSQPLDESWFIDRAHLNTRGRVLFTDWYTNQIVADLQGGLTP